METSFGFVRMLSGGFAFVCVSAAPLSAAPAPVATQVAIAVETEKEAFDAAMAAVKAVVALQAKVDVASREVERCKKDCDAAERTAEAAKEALQAAIRDHAPASVTEAAQRSAISAFESYKLVSDRESRALDRYTGLCLELSAATDTAKRLGDAWIAKSKQSR